MFIINQLIKVDSKGNRKENYLGFEEKAETGKIFNLLSKLIGGVNNIEDMYKILKKQALQYPELNQLVNYKLSDPSKGITNRDEFKALNAFLRTFDKHNITYKQLTHFGNEAKLIESSLDVFSLQRTFEQNFINEQEGEFVTKTLNNNSFLKLEKVIEEFGQKGKPSQLDPNKRFEFLNTIGIKLTDNKRIRNVINTDVTSGVPFMYNILYRFNELQKKDIISKEQSNYIEALLLNPVKVLRQTIPQSILGKQERVGNHIKKLAELEAKMGENTINYGYLTAEGKRVFPNIEHNTLTRQVDALNSAKSLTDLVSNIPYMSYLNPNINKMTTRLITINSMYDMNSPNTNRQRKAKGNLSVDFVSGSQVAESNEESKVTKNLDLYGKLTQDIHSGLNGLFEFIRFGDKNSTMGISYTGNYLTGEQKTNNALFIDPFLDLV